MNKLTETLIKIIKASKKLLIFLAVTGLIVGIYLYFSAFYIIIRFNELGPLTKGMSAYYNGFRIGKISSIEPDKDFKHTLVKVNFVQKNINLPQNSTVQMERFPNGELYLQFIYPSSPSFKTLQSGDMIEGMAPYNLEQFMLGQSVAGVTDMVSLHIIKALNSADVANQQMQIFFKTTSKLINENNTGINAAVNNTVNMTKNLAQASQNLNLASKKLNNAIDSSLFKDATVNIKDTTANIKDTTGNIANATKDIDKTVKKIDDTITQLNATAENLNMITNGVNQTLSKKFGGMRVLFSSSTKPNKETRNACK